MPKSFDDTNELYMLVTSAHAVDDAIPTFVFSLETAKREANSEILNNPSRDEITIYRLVEIGRMKRQNPVYFPTEELT